MLLYVLGLLLLVLLYRTTKLLLAFRRNIDVARQSGIHYVVVPVNWMARWWLMTHLLWVKVLALLPRSWTTWVDYSLPEFSWQYGHEIFERIGHDTFMAVSPTSIALYTSEPAVITQITTRRNDFPKPVDLYQALDIYGKNVVSTEGSEWRHHRKATSPPFTEKNNHLVWSETIEHGQSMLKSWLGPGMTAGPLVDRIVDDTMRLSLYVISGAGFGRSLKWPKNTELQVGSEGHSKIQNLDEDKDAGHKMSWTFALHTLLDTILLQFILPRSLLNTLPGDLIRRARESYREWGQYMNSAAEQARSRQRDHEKLENNILEQLVKSQMDVKGSAPLTQEEIIGNMFVLILAGHETAANSIHFVIIYLALYPESQKRLQQDLDKIFEGKPPSEWDYESKLPALFGGMAGAILAEELRLIPPVINIPKSTEGVKEQPLTVEGRLCTVPSNISVTLAASAVARNPKYWPLYKPSLPGGHSAHPIANIDNDLEEFHPERWFKGTTLDEKSDMQTETLTGGDLGINMSADLSEQLYRPMKGSYIPFSEGYRACLGRRFAQVEVLTVLAVLYQNHSIELAVDKYATTTEIESMNVYEKADVWQKAAEDARDLLLNGTSTIITLQMRRGTVPVRVVPRNQERFPANIDSIWKDNHPEKISSSGIPGWRCWSRK